MKNKFIDMEIGELDFKKNQKEFFDDWINSSEFRGFQYHLSTIRSLIEVMKTISNSQLDETTVKKLEDPLIKLTLSIDAGLKDLRNSWKIFYDSKQIEKISYLELLTGLGVVAQDLRDFKDNTSLYSDLPPEEEELKNYFDLIAKTDKKINKAIPKTHMKDFKELLSGGLPLNAVLENNELQEFLKEREIFFGL